MMWSWVLAFVGLVGFWLAGRKVWWCWYINIVAQILWFSYAIITQQYGFVVSAILYSIVFFQNARTWTLEHFRKEDDG